MHYRIPAENITNGVVVGNNTQLSVTDTSFIASICDGVPAFNGNTSYTAGDKSNVSRKIVSKNNY